jgi:hypothetical protein
MEGRMPVIPPIVIVALGAVGAAALVKFIAKQRDRVNAELDSLRVQKVSEAVEKRPTLRRDPRTGIYRP